MAALSALISATNPATFLGSLSYRGWLGLGLCALLSYCNWISTLSRRPKDAPCPEFGRVLRVLYGLFGTRLAEIVLGYFLFTKAGEPQAEQNGGTVAVTVGRPGLRVEIMPVLGSVLGGNYAYLVWDEADPERRAFVVDPSDPYATQGSNPRAQGGPDSRIACVSQTRRRRAQAPRA